MGSLVDYSDTRRREGWLWLQHPRGAHATLFTVSTSNSQRLKCWKRNRKENRKTRLTPHRNTKSPTMVTPRCIGVSNALWGYSFKICCRSWGVRPGKKRLRLVVRFTEKAVSFDVALCGLEWQNELLNEEYIINTLKSWVLLPTFLQGSTWWEPR